MKCGDYDLPPRPDGQGQSDEEEPNVEPELTEHSPSVGELVSKWRSNLPAVSFADVVRLGKRGSIQITIPETTEGPNEYEDSRDACNAQDEWNELSVSRW